MVWKKILFIFNPVSGRSQIKTNLMEILEILSGADFKIICYATKASGDARRIVREREDDYLYIVCAGGDGTLDEVVSGMMESRPSLFGEQMDRVPSAAAREQQAMSARHSARSCRCCAPEAITFCKYMKEDLPLSPTRDKNASKSPF